MTLDRNEVVDALPNYEVGSELGRGGWGVVLSGRHRQLDRAVAIKQLPKAFASDEAVRARFVTEARLLASLDHPHIVPVYDFVEQEGLCLLVMEQLPGGTVWTRFSTDGLTPPAAAAAVLATLAGLQAAHEHQILHRDVKPENLMFSSTGALKVTDFGIAKVVSGEDTLATRAGEVVGTPAYIAPEQARGGDLSPATDVYAVATMFYELLSGQLPFDDDGDAMALLFKHAFETPTPLRDPAPFVPEVIAAVVMRGLATDPADRYATAEEFGLAIAEACTTAWGPGWLAAEGTPVMGASSIVSATDRVTSPPRPPTLADAPVVAPTDAPAPPTVADPTAAPAPVPPAPTPARTETIRPNVAAHTGGVGLEDVRESDLVPVQSVLIPPAKATVPLLLALVGFVLVVLVAAFGIGSPSHSGDLRAGTVTVASVDPTSGHVVTLNLSRNVAVGVTSAAPAATRARLTLESVGQHIVQASAPLLITHGPVPGRIASVDLTSARYLTGGRLGGEVELLQGGAVVGHQQFAVKTSETGVLTAAGAVTILLLLFALAYGESFARSLRRGRRTRSATFGLAVMGALVGLGLVSLMWVTGFRAPTIATVVVCMVLGAATGVAFAVGATRLGKGRRFAKLEKQRAT
jgi:Protein kinase domain